VAEQLALQELGRKGRAGDQPEALPPAGSNRDGPGQDGLSRAALSAEEKGGFGQGRLPGRFDGLFIRGLALVKSTSGCSRPRSSCRAATFCSRERISKTLRTARPIWAGVKGLGCSRCAAADGLDAVSMERSGDDDDLQPRIWLQGRISRGVIRAQTKVDEGQVERPAGGLADRVGDVADAMT